MQEIVDQQVQSDQIKRSDSELVSDDAASKPIRAFDSGVKFRRIEISSASLNRLLLQFPWMTGKVAIAIYWQALKLWLKRVPFVRHPDSQRLPESK